MLWQDAVVTVVGIIFSISLIPQVYSGFIKKIGPIKYETSVPTFLGCYVIAVVYLTLSLYFSAITSFITGTLWLILLVQRIVYRER